MLYCARCVIQPTDYAGSGSDCSSIYHSHSSLYDDEPLYQIYHRGAVVRDVIEQDAGDDLGTGGSPPPVGGY